MPIRISLLLLLLALRALSLAQALSGSVQMPAASQSRWMVLHAIRGQERLPLDSVRVDRNGRFRFRPRAYPLGYYRLGIGEDQIDLILNPREHKVQVNLGAPPLQNDVTCTGSPENQRLWEYKRASRDAQERLRAIAGQRALLDPLDIASLTRLAQEEDQVKERLSSLLERLVQQDSTSYFAKVVRADQRLMAALPEGPRAIRDAMDWTDASLVRCAIYPKAVMAILQAATPAMPATLATASDSILAWASGDTTCWSFARWQLIDLFSTYGPEEVVQHLVDRYIAGPGSLSPADGRLMALVATQLMTAVGAQAPDVLLPSPITGATDHLLDLIQPHPYTALFFYSSTCDHCHAQMPLLNALLERFGRKGLSILGIALDHDEAEFRANILERGLRFPCYTELLGWGSPAAKAFGVRATPWLILIDRSGRIVAKPHDAAELEELVQRLLP